MGPTMLEGVILAGGKGERFWPLSRPDRPKQLLELFGGESLLRTTWRRLRARLAPDAIWVLTSEHLVPAVRAELPELPEDRLVAEAVGRDTAPAMAVAAALGVRGGRDPVQLVAPSDHWIPDTEAFWRSVERAVEVARCPDHPLVTFGVQITRPETGYGYIERAGPRVQGPGIWQAQQFHEKPDEPTARRYQESGRCFWNSGIFVWRAASLLEEVERWMPALHDLVKDLIAVEHPEERLPDLFQRAPAKSIDFGILERSDRVAVVEADFAWSDVGTWRSWGELAADPSDANTTRGDVLLLDSSGNVVYAEEGLVAALGVKDLVIVRSGDITLVMPKTQSQHVRRILKALKERAGG